MDFGQFEVLVAAVREKILRPDEVRPILVAALLAERLELSAHLATLPARPTRARPKKPKKE